ncbi:hypothetical protein FACS1894217_13490 [Clostridia bacterium]|nr:hypothetical protein FACS1894217_13490 [Clostridia bacterium]
MKASVSFDWVTFTVLGFGNEYELVIKNFLRLKPELFKDSGHGMNGYKSGCSFDGIRVLYDGNYYENQDSARTYPMGVCVSLSGDACRAFETLTPGYGLLQMFRYISGFDGDFVHYTRIDLACDDHCGYLNLDTVIKHADHDSDSEHWVKGRFSDVCTNSSRKKKSGREKAKSVYFGSPSSQRRIRFYDKAKEQGDFNAHWVRCEMVLRGDYANGAVRLILDSGDNVGACAAGLIRDFLEFVEPTDINISRCKLSDWWDRFLEGVSGVKVLVTRKACHTWDKLDKWIRSQLAPSLFVARSMFGDNYLDEVMRNNKHRVCKEKRFLIEEYFDVFGVTSDLPGQELIPGFWHGDPMGAGHRMNDERDERLACRPEKFLRLPDMTEWERLQFFPPFETSRGCQVAFA